MALASLAERSLLAAGAGPEGARYRGLDRFASSPSPCSKPAEEGDGGRPRGQPLATALVPDRDGRPGGRRPGPAGLARGIRRRRAGDLRAALGWAAGLRESEQLPMPAAARRRSPGCYSPEGGCVRPSTVRARPASRKKPESRCPGAGVRGRYRKCRFLGQEALRLDRAAADAFLRASGPPTRPSRLARCAEAEPLPRHVRRAAHRGHSGGVAGRGPRLRRRRSAGARRRRHRGGPGPGSPVKAADRPGALGPGPPGRGSVAGQRRAATSRRRGGSLRAISPGVAEIAAERIGALWRSAGTRAPPSSERRPAYRGVRRARGRADRAQPAARRAGVPPAVRARRTRPGL